MVEETLDVTRFILAVSSLNSLADPVLTGHNYRVAYLSFVLARELTYSTSFLYTVLLSGLLHDVGLLLSSSQEVNLVKVVEDSGDRFNIQVHAEIGYRLLKEFPFFSKIANTIRYHHTFFVDYLHNPKGIPYASMIIHAADRIDVFVSSRLNAESPYYTQVPKLKRELEEYLLRVKGTQLDPTLVRLFLTKISPKESFWFEFLGDSLKRDLELLLSSFSAKMPIQLFYQLAQIFAYLIDFKSPFTATHSSGVAQVATSLASLFNFTSPDLKKMKVAGLLHDLGKVAVPKRILEKKGRLTENEYCLMKSHVFHTFKILKELSVHGEVLEWASYHHETLDGKGYPFKLSAKELSLGSRIMAVADVFTALMEDRPYKKGMKPREALSIIEEMTKNKKLDARVFAVLKANFKTIEGHRRVAQGRAVRLYEELKRVFY